MKAYRGHGNSFIEIEVDIDPITNEPILPLNSTVTPPPTPGDGMQVTLVDGEWKEIPLPEIKAKTLEEIKEETLSELEAWKELYLALPFVYEGNLYHGDSKARDMINSSILALREFNRLPKTWITFTGTPITNVTESFLKGLAEVFHDTYEERFLTTVAIASEISKAIDIDELDAIVIPELPTVEDIISKYNEENPLQGVERNEVPETEDESSFPTPEEIEEEFLKSYEGMVGQEKELEDLSNMDEVLPPTHHPLEEGDFEPEEESEQVE